MKNYERIFVIVLDSLGIGAMPDSANFGDTGVDTFGHILEKMGSLDIPNLAKLGMLNLHPAGNMTGASSPEALSLIFAPYRKLITWGVRINMKWMIFC